MLKKIFSIFLFIIFTICIFYSDYSKNEKVSDNSKMIFPTNTTIDNISSYYGGREIDGVYSFHNGTDFPVVQGTPVYATLSGTVTYSDFMQGYGNCITIVHNNGLKSLYGHLSEGYMAKLGKNVKAGELIAYVGPKYLSDGRLNGYTTGPHLHFSLFDSYGNSINPLSYSYTYNY